MTEEPLPNWITIRVQRCPRQPPEMDELDMVRVKVRKRSGGWSYETVLNEDVVG